MNDIKEEDNGLSKQEWKQILKDELAQQKQLINSSDHIYELFGVLVHNGTATSGHYYAFIKDVEDD